MSARSVLARLTSGPTSHALDLVKISSGVRSQTSGLQNPASWVFDYLTDGVRTGSGAAVGPTAALAHGDVYACVRVLSDAVASLPLITYRERSDGGRERAMDTPPAQLLTSPSPLLTPKDLWGMVTAHLNCWGNAYIAKLRVGSNGPVKRLWPIQPGYVRVEVADGEPVFIVQPHDGMQGGTFSRLDILHIKGLTTDGYTGTSPIGQAREAVGIGIAMEEYAARWFANSAFPAGVIQMPGALSADAAKRLKVDWEMFHRGQKNSSRVAVLEGGATFSAQTMPPADAQFVEQRHLSATMIARIFRVPPWMIAADANSRLTYSNVEQQMLQFATYSVRPWLVTIEQALLADEDIYPVGDGLYPEFLMDSLLRADTATRNAAYTEGFGRWLTRNEIRISENMLPVPGGDEFPAAVAPPSPAAGDVAPPEPTQAPSDNQRSM